MRGARTTQRCSSGSRARRAGARRTASVCTGAFLLAARGPARRAPRDHPLGVRRGARARCIPRCEVDPEPIFLRDGAIWTSAGVTAGMDLALALVEEDLDRERGAARSPATSCCSCAAPATSRSSAPTLAAQQPEREPLREVQRYVVEDVAGDALGRGDGRARPHEPAPLRPRVSRRDRRHARPATSSGCAWRRPAGGWRTRPSRSQRSRRRAASAPPRRCAASSCARSRSGRPSTAAASSPERAARRCLRLAGPTPPSAHHQTNRQGDRHEHRNPALRPLHRARRGRALRGAEPPARRHVTFVAAERRARAHRQRHAHARWPSARSRSSPTPDIVLVPGGPGEVAAARRRAGARVAAHRARDQHVDDLGLHRLADPRRRRACSTGKRATSHWLALEELGALGRRAGRPSGSCSTARSSPARASRRASTWRSRWRRGSPATRSRRRSSSGIEYDPQPPFDAGSPQKAPAEIVEAAALALRASSRGRSEPRARAATRVQPAASAPAPPANLRLDGGAPLRPAGDRAPLAGGVGRASAPGRSPTTPSRTGREARGHVARTGRSQLLRARDAALPERRAAHRPPQVLLGGRRDRALPPPPRPPRAAPDGLRRVRAAGREPRDQDGRAPARLDGRVDRLLPAPVPLVGDLDRLVARAGDVANRATTAGRSGSSSSCSAAGLAYRKEAAVKWCPQRPDGARQRAGRRRRALRALRRAGRSAPARAVVPAHHRLRRAAARRPRRDRLARARQDDAAQLDRAQRGRRGDVPLRGARRSTTPCSRPARTRCSARPSS